MDWLISKSSLDILVIVNRSYCQCGLSQLFVCARIRGPQHIQQSTQLSKRNEQPHNKNQLVNTN